MNVLLVSTGKATVLQIEPARVFLFPTEDLQLRLIFLKDDGTAAAPEAVQWRSFRPEVATIDGTGPGDGGCVRRRWRLWSG